MKLEEVIEIIEHRLQTYGVEDYLEVVSETNRIFQDLNSQNKIRAIRISSRTEAIMLKEISNLVLGLMQKEYGSPRDIFSQEFVEYVKSHYTNGQRYRLSSQIELIKALRKSRLGFVGDLHYVKETKKSLINIIQGLMDSGEKVILGLESIKTSQQGILESYQQDDLAYNEFLEELINTGSERFMIEFSKEIYEFAKNNRSRIKLLGLDADGSLEERDCSMSLAIVDSLKENSQNIFVVFAGSGHVAKDHLPKKTMELSGVDGAIIYQNLPSIYYKLLSRNMRPEGVVVKLCQQEFCIFNINPLEETISMQDYRNSLLEEPDFLPPQYKRNAGMLYQAVLKMFLMNKDNYFKNLPCSCGVDKPKTCQELKVLETYQNKVL